MKITSDVFDLIFKEACDAAVEKAEEYYIEHGEPFYCGFAWVEIKGNTSFGRLAKKKGFADSGYPSGLKFSSYTVSDNAKNPNSIMGRTQSMDIKEIAMEEFAQVLRTHGISDAWMHSRAD